MEGVMRKGEIKQSSSEASILLSLLARELSFAFAVAWVSDRRFTIDSVPVILANVGKPSDSERCSSVLALYCSCCWWCGSILSLRHPRERGDPSYSEHRGSFFALHCCCWLRFRRCLLRQVHFQTRLLARADEWIPACAGMTVGGVAAVC